ncbi:MAG: hypothetical protein C0391_03405 [Anaerolinea sp.]|nr:hypothetical protein [Anaerolinea sp.]
MPKIEVRTAVLEDIPAMMDLDHSYHTDYVWQMDLISEDRYVSVNFQENRLPRSVKVDYPRNTRQLMKDWIHRDALLVALIEKKPVAYISVTEDLSPSSAWITDMVVAPVHRRAGIGTALIVAVEQWAVENRLKRMIVDVQSKNMPAIKCFHKLGYSFCGYNDHFYANQDIALFFSHYLG